MKPIHLKISGWGPYSDYIEIDFVSFEQRGLFLITGATGAGKTTIFDAITYALYGDLSGNTREKNSVRSDFAKAEIPTYVEFLFSHKGESFKVRRNPEYLRASKRAAGKEAKTKQKENAILNLPDNMVIEGTKEVNEKIKEILVLDYIQFKQVTMIAQGEFTRLLLAKPQEKTKIFRELFHTQIYNEFTQELKNKTAKLYARVKELERLIAGEIDRVYEKESIDELSVVDKISDEIQQLEHLIHELEKKQEVLGKKKEDYVGECRKLELLVEKNCLLQKLEKSLLELTANEKVIDQKEERLILSKKASSVQSEFHELEQSKHQFEQVQKEIAVAKEEIQQAQKELSLHEIYVIKKEAFQIYYEKQKEENNAQKELQEKEQNIVVLKKKQVQENTKFEILQKEKVALEREYEILDFEYKKSIIGIIAQELKEGIECPVCGSLTHPKKAMVKDDSVSEEILKAHKKRVAEIQKSYELQFQKAQECKAALEYEEEQQQQLQHIVTQISRERIEFKETSFGEIEILEEVIFQAIVLKCIQTKIRMEEKSIWMEKKQGEIEKLQQMVEVCEANFEAAWKTKQFASEIEVKHSFLSYEVQQKLEEEILQYREQKKEIEVQIMHLKNDVLGFDEEQVSILNNKKRELEVELKSGNEQLKGCQSRLVLLTSTKSFLQQKEKEKILLEKEYGIVKDLENMATGNNEQRLVFEQYVLAGYFEQILKAANLRLARLTAERYELSKVREVNDGRSKDNLEIQVFDYYTGRNRSIKTLSGGELFKASLCLALGLSDIIQCMNGGAFVEALFLDEGFGALDQESLEQACHVLQGLAQNQRMIGIISHVAQLREEIGNQIVVHKTNSGSKIEIMLT